MNGDGGDCSVHNDGDEVLFGYPLPLFNSVPNSSFLVNIFTLNLTFCIIYPL